MFIYLMIIIVNYGYMKMRKWNTFLHIKSEVNLPASSTKNEMLTTYEANYFPLVTVVISMLI